MSYENLPDRSMDPPEGDGYGDWYDMNYEEKLSLFVEDRLWDDGEFCYDLAEFLAGHPAKLPMTIYEAARSFITGTPRYTLWFDKWMQTEYDREYEAAEGDAHERD